MDDLPWYLQQERRRCVAADAARKHSAHKWTNWDLPVPEKLLRRETVEFDIRHGLLLPPQPPAPAAPPAQLIRHGLQPPLQIYEGSSSIAWSFSGGERGSLSMPRTLMSRQVAVDEFEIYDPRAFESSVDRYDFVPEEALATVTSAVQARSAEEVQAAAKRRRREDDLDELMLEQGFDQDRLHHEQEAAKARAKEKGKAVVIDIPDDSEEE